jgi:hypothetical protein
VNQYLERPWFTEFVVELDDRPISQIIWADGADFERTPVPVRKPTGKERASILLVGAIALGSIVVMVVTLIVAVYISRR